MIVLYDLDCKIPIYLLDAFTGAHMSKANAFSFHLEICNHHVKINFGILNFGYGRGNTSLSKAYLVTLLDLESSSFKNFPQIAASCLRSNIANKNLHWLPDE